MRSSLNSPPPLPQRKSVTMSKSSSIIHGKRRVITPQNASEGHSNMLTANDQINRRVNNNRRKNVMLTPPFSSTAKLVYKKNNRNQHNNVQGGMTTVFDNFEDLGERDLNKIHALNRRLVSLSIADMSPKLVERRLIALCNRRQFEEASSLVKRLSTLTFREVVPHIPIQGLASDIARSLVLVDTIFDKIFSGIPSGLQPSDWIRKLNVNIEVEDLFWKLVKMFTATTPSNCSDLARKQHHSMMNNAKSITKSLLVNLLKLDPSLSRLLFERQKVVDDALEGLGQHGLVVSSSGELTSLQLALKSEMTKNCRIITDIVCCIDKMNRQSDDSSSTGKYFTSRNSTNIMSSRLFSSSSSSIGSSSTDSTSSVKHPPVAQSHQRQLSLRYTEIQQRLHENYMLIRCVEPMFSAVADLNAMVNMLRRRINLDKQVLHLFHELTTSPGGSNSTGRLNGIDQEMRIVAPHLINFQKGCLQVMSIFETIHENSNLTSCVTDKKIDSVDISASRESDDVQNMRSSSSDDSGGGDESPRYKMSSENSLDECHSDRVETTLLPKNKVVNFKACAKFALKSNTSNSADSMKNGQHRRLFQRSKTLLNFNESKSHRPPSNQHLHRRAIGLEWKDQDGGDSSSSGVSSSEGCNATSRSEVKCDARDTSSLVSSSSCHNFRTTRRFSRARSENRNDIPHSKNYHCKSRRAVPRSRRQRPHSLVNFHSGGGIVDTSDMCFAQRLSQMTDCGEEKATWDISSQKFDEDRVSIDSLSLVQNDFAATQKRESMATEKELTTSIVEIPVNRGEQSIRMSMPFGNDGCRAANLVRDYGNLYSIQRLQTLDALIDTYENRSGMKLDPKFGNSVRPSISVNKLFDKILYSVVVLSFRSAKMQLTRIEQEIRALLQLDTLPSGASVRARTEIDLTFQNSDVESMRTNVLSIVHCYLKRSVNMFDVKCIEEDVTQQLWQTLYDYPSLRTCSQLERYISLASRIAWGLTNQDPQYSIEFESVTFKADVHVRNHISDTNSTTVRNYVWPALIEGVKDGPCVFKAVVVT